MRSEYARGGVSADSASGRRREQGEFPTALARAFGGAIFFSLPLMMTMEMWWLGFYMERLRLALFMVLMIPVLIGLSHYSGIRHGTTWMDDVADAFVAYAVGFVASAVVLALFNLVPLSGTSLREFVGKVSLQAVSASFGAVLANSQLGSGAGDEGTEERRKEAGSYGTELFLMFAGALFLAFNVAPTEEMIVIAFKMTPWHAIALLLATLAMVHAFVYSVEFQGTESAPEGTPGWSVFARYSLVGYAVAFLASAYVLWTFGRLDDQPLVMDLTMSLVLAFPAGLGAAAARLIL